MLLKERKCIFTFTPSTSPLSVLRLPSLRLGARGGPPRRWPGSGIADVRADGELDHQNRRQLTPELQSALAEKLQQLIPGAVGLWRIVGHLRH